MIPPYNLKGVFVLAEPFNSLIDERAVYEVVGINDIRDLEADGKSPYATIYAPVGLTQADILDDINRDIPIITLLGEGNNRIYIPADRIIKTPKITGYLHQDTVITVPLGAIPKSLDLSVLCDDIKGFVLDRLGIDSTVKVAHTSASVLLSNQEHHRYEAVRRARIKMDKSYRTKYLEEKEKLRKCEFIKKKMEEEILKEE